MALLEGRLNQRATYWKPLPRTAHGPGGWNAPEHIDVRWQEKQQMVRTREGVDRVSGAVIHLITPIEFGSRLHLGETSEPNPANVISFEPLAISAMVDLMGETVGWKVYI